MSERKVAIVTGSTRGIGAATALELARRGYDLCITGRDQKLLDQMAAQVQKIGRSTLALLGDLADLDFAKSLIDRTIEKFGQIDLLVSNAAWRELLTMRQITVEGWEKTLRICLTSPAFMARWAAEHMEKRRKGVIINVSSIMSNMVSGISPAYVASKGAMDTLSYDLATLYGPSGIRVIAINPGAIDTEMSNDHVSEDQKSLAQRLRSWSESMIPLQRWGTAEDIARAIAMLASDDAAYLTGTKVVVDGGWSHSLDPQDLKHEMKPDQFAL